MLNQIKRVKEIQNVRDDNIRMTINVNTKETLNTYATANIKVQHYNSEKKDNGWNCFLCYSVNNWRVYFIAWP